MHPKYIIERASPTPSEAADIHRVERLTLHDSAYSPEEMLAVLRVPGQYIYIVRQGAEAVGFCSCFETATHHGARLEIDMLGVLPAHRGKGIARRLIQRSTREAALRGVSSARAVVASENRASQHAFVHAGLKPGRRCELMVYEFVGTVPIAYLPKGWDWRLIPRGCIRVKSISEPFCARGSGCFLHALCDATDCCVALAECQRVQTLAYQGVWIERLWAASDEALSLLARAVIEWGKRLDLDEVGYLAPRPYDDEAVCERLVPLVRQGFHSRGCYLAFSMGLD